jgi:alpha-2-macroglobulin
MLKSLSFARLSTLIASFIFLISCNSIGKRDWIEVSSDFIPYVQAYTGGIISTSSGIRVRLTQATKLTISPGELIDNELFAFEPNIIGKVRWTDAETVEFVPEKSLPMNEMFHGNFKLASVTQTPDQLKEFKFSFKTLKQSARFECDFPQTESLENPNKQYVSGFVESADVAKLSDIEKCIVAKQNGRILPISWSQDQNKKKHRFSINDVSRGTSASKVEVSYSGKAIQADESSRQIIEIPPKGNFHVVGVKLNAGSEPTLDIQFSDPIKEMQVLQGLLKVYGTDKPDAAIDGQKIRVYLPGNASGSIETEVFPGIVNAYGESLAQGREFQSYMLFPKPGIRFHDDGNILPQTTGMLIPFEAVNLNKVDIEITRILESNIPRFLSNNSYGGSSSLKQTGKIVAIKTIPLEISNIEKRSQYTGYSLRLDDLVKPEPGAIYRVKISYQKEYVSLACLEKSDDEGLESPKEKPNYKALNKPGYYGDDYYGDDYYYDYDEEYDWEERDNPCSASFYRHRESVSKNILATDIGLMAKEAADGTWHFWSNSLLEAKPMAGVRLDILDYQASSIAQMSTDKDGYARLSGELTDEPFLLVASVGKQKSYLKLVRGEMRSTGSFDVSGEVIEEGLKAFLYGERGVWRPGDTLFLSSIIEPEGDFDKESLQPPIMLDIINPRNQRIYKEIRPFTSSNRLYTFKIPTHPDAPTGTYQARMQIGSAVFVKYLKVETIQPNRLKIKLDFPREELRYSDAQTPLKLSSTWLHGSPASNLRANVTAVLHASSTQFNNFKGYVFDDPTRTAETEEITIFDAPLNEDGKADVYPIIRSNQSFPGKVQADFTARVFEAGGQFSIDQFSMPYLPFPVFVGISAPAGSGYDGALEPDKKHRISIASVKDNGTAMPNRKVQVAVYKLETNWWWQRNSINVNDYYHSNSTTTFRQGNVQTDANGKTFFELSFDEAETGVYLIRVSDSEGGHAAGTVISVMNTSSRPDISSPVRNSRELQLSADKESYAQGETMKIGFPSPEGGKALINIEDGRSILYSQWVDTESGMTYVKLKAESDYAPNVYVHVTVFQPYSKENDLPLRMYGIVRIPVSNPNSKLEPILAIPEVIRPEGITTIGVSEKKGQAMEYTLALVDEGLLDLTRFKTPDPWTAMNATEALGVNTWDLYDYVIGRYSGTIESEIRIGGDMMMKGKDENARANRFKPMVRFLGPFKLKKGEKAQHKIAIPAYYGSVRVMVIATSEKHAWGNAEKAVPVRKPLMLLSTLPRVLSPSEEIQVPVNVFALENAVKNVEVTISVSGNLKINGDSKKTVTFAKTGDQLVPFAIKVGASTGIAKVTIKAKSGNETAISETEIEIRTPNPMLTESQEILLSAGETWKGNVQPVGMPGTRSASIELSGMPAINLSKRLDYLTSYPHGCLEQTTSAAFPQLFLEQLVDLKEIDKKKIKVHIEAALRKIPYYQTSTGGMGYWQGARQADDWSTSYVGHFMLEARQKGYSVSSDVFASWKKYQQSMAKNWSPNPKNTYEDGLLQSYRLFTLALAASPDVGAMNRLREFNGLSKESAAFLAAAYLASGQKETAGQLLLKAENTLQNSRNYRYSYGDSNRDLAVRLWVTARLGLRKQAMPLAIEVAKSLGSNTWMSTQTTSWSLLAMTQFYRDRDAQRIDATIVQNGKSNRIFTNKTMVSEKVELQKNLNAEVSITNPNKAEVFVRLITAGIPGTNYIVPAKASNLQMIIRMSSTDGKLLDPSSIAQGTDVQIEVMVSNPANGKPRNDLALDMMMASGWEIQNNRLNDMQDANESAYFEYQDIRDDRIQTYFSLNNGASKTFNFRFNAAYLGKFYLPAWRCESMYDNTCTANSASQWIQVVPRTPKTTASR